jgi:hypothetical protein
LPIRKTPEVPQRYMPSGQNSDTTISSFCESHDVTSAQLLIVVQRGKICWRFGGRTLIRYRSLISINLVSVWEVNFILFNSMLKYVINRLMHAFFHIRTVIIPLADIGLSGWQQSWYGKGHALIYNYDMHKDKNKNCPFWESQHTLLLVSHLILLNSQYLRIGDNIYLYIHICHYSINI